MANDADDPVIWINTAHPERSLVVVTNKVAAPDGALYVFGLDGTVRQIVKPLYFNWRSSRIFPIAFSSL